MTYRIVVEPPAVADTLAIHEFAALRAPEYADRQLEWIQSAVDSLADFPKRYALAPEATTHHKEIRQLVVGNSRKLFMVIMQSVHILRIRHVAQAPLQPGELN